MTLETLLSLGLKAKHLLANKLAKKMASDQWMSTQTTAYCLLAMSKFAQNNGTKGIAVQFKKKEGKLKLLKRQNLLQIALNC
jgi:hypothetical protein